MRDYADFFPRRANAHVPDMSYSAEVDETGSVKIVLGNPIAGIPNIILNAGDLAPGTAFRDFADTYSPNAMGEYGRNVTVVASGAATQTVTVRGLDYLGQPMSETLTLAGTTPVVGKKAFKHIEEVVPGGAVAGTTINVGVGNVFGLPWYVTRLLAENVDGVAPGTAGTFVAGVTAQSATSGDPRGTYAPHSSAVPNGSRRFELLCMVKEGNLHGVPHFRG